MFSYTPHPPATPMTWSSNNTLTNPSMIKTATGITAEDVMIVRPGRTPLQVGKTLDTIMDRLCIIEPSFQLMDKYPALKEAYNAYKIIEDMCRAGDKQDE